MEQKVVSTFIDDGVDYKICCDIEGFKGLDLCDADFITEEDIFLGNKDFQSLKKGDCISVLNNAVIIQKLYITTHSQFNEECERLEMQDWI